ncbi:MAG: LytTR family transcriptional regulator DNA-binding domain-containing protein [Leadbetterella sp.]
MKTTIVEDNILKVHIGSRKYLRPEDMMHLESDLNYTVISLINGDKIVSSTALKIIESRLSPFKKFVRVNRQSVVNLDWVTVIQDNVCVLQGNMQLTFSRRRAKEFAESKRA